MKEKINIAKFYLYICCKYMKIDSYNTLNHIPIYFRGKNKFLKPKIFQKQKADTFEKTTSSVQKCQKTTASLSEEDRINQFYNEVFDKILFENPIMNQVNSQKPSLVFKDDMNSNATYDFTTNSLELNSKFKKDLYAFLEYDDEGEITYCDIFFEDSIKNEIKSAKANKSKYEAFRLNQTEKELYIKSILAHELRHWIQEHILVSTQNCQDVFDYKFETTSEIIEIIKHAISILRNLDMPENKIETWENKLKEANESYSYILNYKVQIIFSENQTLKLALSSQNNKFWSIKKHLLPAFLKYNNSCEKEYETNPTEIDAYNFQTEFLFKEYLNNSKNIREKAFQAMSTISIGICFSHLEKLEEHGYPPLIEE